MAEDAVDRAATPREADTISASYIWKRFGLSRSAFADTLGIKVATLLDREQNRVTMEPATIALVHMLVHEPEPSLPALRRSAA